MDYEMKVQILEYENAQLRKEIEMLQQRGIKEDDKEFLGRCRKEYQELIEKLSERDKEYTQIITEEKALKEEYKKALEGLISLT